MEKQRLVINHPAVWVAIILTQFIPVLWYRAFRFTPYYEGVADRMDAAAATPALFAIGLLAGIVAMYLLAWLFSKIEVESMREGLIAGLIIGLAFNVYSIITIYSFTEYPIEIGMIDFGTNALVFSVAGLVLGGWRKYA